MAGNQSAAKTLYDKLWDDHLVFQRDDGSCLLYIDRHLLHEVTSPQAFEGLQLAGRQPWRLVPMLQHLTIMYLPPRQSGHRALPVSQMKPHEFRCKP